MKLVMKVDKVCKNSIRYTATKEAMAEVGVSQPFSIYVPNALVVEGKDLEVTLDFK